MATARFDDEFGGTAGTLDGGDELLRLRQRDNLVRVAVDQQERNGRRADTMERRDGPGGFLDLFFTVSLRADPSPTIWNVWP